MIIFAYPKFQLFSWVWQRLFTTPASPGLKTLFFCWEVALGAKRTRHESHSWAENCYHSATKKFHIHLSFRTFLFVIFCLPVAEFQLYSRHCFRLRIVFYSFVHDFVDRLECPVSRDFRQQGATTLSILARLTETDLLHWPQTFCFERAWPLRSLARHG